MIASRISVLILSLKDEFPNRIVFVKLDKVYLGINFVKVAHEGTSFVKKKGTLEKKVRVRFNVNATVTERV